MNQSDLALLETPAHELVIEELARKWIAESKAMTDKARAELEQRFRHIEATYNRSLAQRRRYWRIRTIQEKTA